MAPTAPPDQSAPSKSLLICTFAVRFLLGCILVLATVSYTSEFADDQGYDFGSRSAIWSKVTNFDPHNPGHRGEKLYIILFLTILLFSLLGLVGIFFENVCLLCIHLPVYLVLVILDYMYVGKKWRKIGYWSGYCTIIFGVLVIVVGIIFVLLLLNRGPSTLAAVFDDDEEDQPVGQKTTGGVFTSAFTGNYPTPKSHFKGHSLKKKSRKSTGRKKEKPNGE